MKRVVGLDVALENQGVAIGRYDGKRVFIDKIIHLNYSRDPKLSKSRADVKRIQLINRDLRQLIKGADYVMAEIPSGSRSAASAWALGIAIGILACLPCEIIWVTPNQVKRVVKPKATKQDMINWAVGLYPDFNWYRSRGRLIEKNSHCSDAIAVIYAGLSKIPKI